MPRPVVVAFPGKRYPKLAKSVPAMAAIKAPPVVVFNIEPAVIDDTAKFVEVACPSVVLPVTPRVPPTTTFPAASIVVLAVPPNAPVLPVTLPAYEFVEVAYVVVEFVVVSPPLKARAVDVALLGNKYENVADVMQLPFCKKHPPESAMPLAKVEVAVVDATLRVPIESPPVNVDVAVEVAK